MLSLNIINGAKILKPGDVIHFRVVDLVMTSPGRWKLAVEDITPLPGAEPTGYGCHGCGVIEAAAEKGGLPEGWVKKDFIGQSYFLCPECQKDFRYCRVCGCSDEDACEEGCHWVEEDLCSSCVDVVGACPNCGGKLRAVSINEEVVDRCDDCEWTGAPSY